MSSGGPRNVVDVEFRPFEPTAQCCERLRYETLVHLDDVEDWVARVDALKIIDDLADRRLGAAKIEAGLGAERVRPGRR